MIEQQKQHYSKLVEFLGYTLGPDYEVVLHDVSTEQPCIIAIANGELSGRSIGAPLTNVAAKLIKDGTYKIKDWILNYQGISGNGRLLRCSTFFIKDQNGTLQGLLCINFDDARYRELSTRVYRLCHPDAYVSESIRFFSFSETPPSVPAFPRGNADHPDGRVQDEESLRTESADSPEIFFDSLEAAAQAAIASVVPSGTVLPSQLTRKEKIEIISLMNQRGIFRVKGAIPVVAKALSCSQATVYRYLSKAKSGQL
jgi:predicted transcriptional regulator YheO